MIIIGEDGGVASCSGEDGYATRECGSAGTGSSYAGVVSGGATASSYLSCSGA